MTEVQSGIYRHYKGHLYQVLFCVDLYCAQPVIGHVDPARELFRARDSTNATEGRGMIVDAVCILDDIFVSGDLRLTAWPVPAVEDDPNRPTCELADSRPGVVYIGLTLDGDPKPGLRPRVRDLEEFTGMVDVGGERVPRFRFVGQEWPVEG